MSALFAGSLLPRRAVETYLGHEISPAQISTAFRNYPGQTLLILIPSLP